MKRIVSIFLSRWKDDPDRKPLIIRGARQVGKTTMVRQLGKQYPSFVEINFERLARLRHLFEGDLEPTRIIRDIELETGQRIVLGETLLFFDEVQNCPQALLSLRYFYESCPQQPIIAAGSLLDFAIDMVGVPVGRVSFLYVYPMTFIEFLWAMDKSMLADDILSRNPDQPMNEALHQKLLRLLGEYMAIGGMPEAVAKWRQTSDYRACLTIHQDILAAYTQDFAKYAKKTQIKYVDLMFQESCHQSGRSFSYAAMSEHYRQRELFPALTLLKKANVITQITHSAAQGIPLGAQSNPKFFKLIMVDIGLMQSLLGVTAEDWILNPEQAFINKGAVAEAFVGQELLGYSYPRMAENLYYWQRDQKGSQAEVDYLLLDAERKIIPVEVKAGSTGRLRSLWQYLGEHPESPYGIRYATQNYSLIDKLRTYPLYAIAHAAWKCSL